jgi:tetratricopeptide (TPR) repeat protein
MELTAGQQQPVPDWLAETAPSISPFSATYTPEVPDWIREAEAAVAIEQIPDWLNEPLEEPRIEELPPIYTPPPAPEPTPVRAASELRSPVPERPVPLPVSAAASGSLDQARRMGQSGDIAGALVEYESLIRANFDLETVVDDLSKIVSANRTNAAAYRVLGDGLMRQGKLQAALETYRQALNQL